MRNALEPRMRMLYFLLSFGRAAVTQTLLLLLSVAFPLRDVLCSPRRIVLSGRGKPDWINNYSTLENMGEYCPLVTTMMMMMTSYEAGNSFYRVWIHSMVNRMLELEQLGRYLNGLIFRTVFELGY